MVVTASAVSSYHSVEGLPRQGVVGGVRELQHQYSNININIRT